jgi:hypothetical protein
LLKKFQKKQYNEYIYVWKRFLKSDKKCDKRRVPRVPNAIKTQPNAVSNILLPKVSEAAPQQPRQPPPMAMQMSLSPPARSDCAALSIEKSTIPR